MSQTDCNLMLWLNFDGGGVIDTLMWWASQKLTWIPLYVLILALVWHRHGWRYMVAMMLMIVVGVALSDQICNIFKDGVKFLRPTHTNAVAGQLHTVNDYLGGLYGTVSAHAATTVSIAVISAEAFGGRIYNLLMLLWVAVVCYSRVYLGVHFPSQILFGIVLGLAVGFLLRWIFRRYVAPRVSR